MAKAKAGRVGIDITLRCVELRGTVGYSEDELLEKALTRLPVCVRSPSLFWRTISSSLWISP